MKLLPLFAWLAAVVLLVSCSPSGHPNAATRKPNREDLIADYVPTEETLERLKSDGYPDQEIVITLQNDGGLSLSNIPDCWLSLGGDPHAKFDSGIGRWQLAKNNAVWAVSFKITKFRADSANYTDKGVDYPGCAVVLHNQKPHGLSLSVAAGDKGWLEFRHK
ncbi:MAG: hypothetical protein ABIP85_11825 [Chthoniobacteraceae bacterium]